MEAEVELGILVGGLRNIQKVLPPKIPPLILEEEEMLFIIQITSTDPEDSVHLESS